MGRLPTAGFWQPIVGTVSFMVVDAFALATLWHLDAARMRALEDVAAAESQAADLLENVDLFVGHINPEGKLDFANAFGLELTGYQREEIIGKDYWDTFPTPDRREAARENWRHVVAGERQLESRRESTICTKSGEIKVIRWSHVHRYGPDGRLRGWSAWEKT